MMFLTSTKRLARLLASLRHFLWALPLSIGCLNPELVNQTTGNLYPTAPGGTPFVLASFLNDSTSTIDLTLNVDDGGPVLHSFPIRGLSPGQRTEGLLIPWPFLRMGIGNLDNPFDTTNSIAATLPDGLTVQVPFGHQALVAGQDFTQGDAVLFEMINNIRSQTAITTSVGVVQGTTQTGPFSRADTFRTVQLLLLNAGLGGTVGSPIP